MPRPYGLSQWQDCVSTHFSHLSAPQRQVLAIWSFGIVLAQSCGLTTVAVCMATLFQQRDQTLIQRLRDWYRSARHKGGAAQGCKRREVAVTTCFAPLLRWVIQLLPADCGTLALAMDASTLGQRFTILNISVVIRGSAIPVAWMIVPATAKGAWRPHWEALFGHLRDVTPVDWTVIVLADRGLYAPWLFRTITALGWHPFLRINRQGQFRPAGATDYQPLSQVVSKGGPAWRGRVTCFKTRERQMDATLLARWDAAYTEPWLILTDLPPDAAEAIWYGMRAWIEGSYKDAKRGGWHWEQTKMTDPRRAERLWLAMALATLWVVSVGCAAEVAQPAANVDALPPTHVARRSATGRRAPRAISCFRRGRLVLLAALLHGGPLPVMRLVPEPWPKSLDTPVGGQPDARPHQDAVAQKRYT